MRRTLVVTHVMPLELEMFERFIIYYKEGFKYLDPSTDDVTMYVTLNLNPKLTDWENSELKPQWFIDKFTKSMEGIRSYLQIVVDDSLWGTTQQKREVIELDYDQFIFVDPDISVHEQQLKLQLMASEQLSGPFIISPNIPKWWDGSWDVIVHPNFKNREIQQFRTKESWDNTFTQSVDEVTLEPLRVFKFGCGMHTLYSKEFWKTVGIPNEFGGYGSEDTYAMFASVIARKMGIDVRQYVLNGLYITEDKDEEHREPSYKTKIKVFDLKHDGKKYSNDIMGEVLQKFADSLLNKQI
jgi:hypothetical protein